MSDTDEPLLGATRRHWLKLVGAAGAGALGTGGAVGGYLATRDDDRDATDPPDGEPQGHAHEAALALVPPGDATHVATSDGPWDDPDTWDAGVPDDAARVHVPEGIDVSLEHRDSARLRTVRVDGTLSVVPDRDTHLRVDTLVTAPGAVLEVGTPDAPIEPDVEARLTVADVGPIDESWDPTRVSRGVIAMGRTRLHGAETTPHAELATHPRAGDERLELADDPTNWTRGDRLIVAGVDPATDEDEEVFVESVDGATVRIDRALEYDHVPPRTDLPVHVAHLDRNVRVVSESSGPDRRGHVMFTSSGVDVHHAGFYEVGRTDKSRPFTNPEHGTPPADADPNPKGRYGCHFHHVGTDPDARPAVVRGAVVRGSPGWGFVNHGSHVRITDSVTYDVFGAGFVAEAGTEIGAFRRNVAIRSAGSGETTDSRQFREGREGNVDDFGHGGHGFWLQGPGVAVEENVAAGHRHFGFAYWTRAIVDRELEAGEEIGGVVGGVRNFPVEHVEGQERLLESDRVHEGKVPSSFVKLRPFRDNVAYASGGGFELVRHQFTRPHAWFDEWSVIDGFTAYGLGPLESPWGHVYAPDAHDGQGGNNGISLRYSHNVLVRNARLIGPEDEDPPTVSTDGREDVDEATRRADSVGINRNGPFSNVLVEGSTIEGFARGLRVPRRALCHVRDPTLENALDVEIEAGGTDGRWPAPLTVWLDGGSFEEDATIRIETRLEGDVDGIFGDRGGIRLNDREVYLDAQRPDAVPVPDADAAAALDDADRLSELATGEVDPGDLVGKTNRELEDAYGLAVGGSPAPETAVDDDRLEGGSLQRPASERPDHAVWLEAEDGELTAPFEVRADDLASGGEYVSADGYDSWGEAPAEGRARYAFTVDEGEFEVWGRFETPDGHGAVWARIDGGDWIPWSVGAGRGYEWAPLIDDREETDDERVVRTLAAGEHELELAYREGATRLDELLVTAEGTTPVRRGE